MIEKKESKKKEETKNTEEKAQIDIKKRERKQIKWIIIIMISLLLIIFLVYIIQEESKKFYYAGMPFTKTKFGEIPLYRVRLTGHGITGNAINMNFNLRNDPRELEHIPVPKIQLLRDPVYISVSPEINCSNTMIALINLGVLLGRSGLGFEIKDGAPDLEFAQEREIPYITCDEFPEKTVIMISPGNITEIKRPSYYCYEITFKDCEILEVLERFEVAALAGAKGREL